MIDSTTFSLRKNAKRAAEKAIRDGTAPGIDYGFREADNGRVEIIWKASAAEAIVAAENDPADEIAEAPLDSSGGSSDGEQNMADRFPPGTRVIVQVTARKRRTGTVEYRVDATSCRVKFDGPNPSVLCRYSQLSPDDGSAPTVLPAKGERSKTEQGNRKPSKSAELDAAAARGEMPTKPIITSAANQKQYQPRFDQLEKWAAAGDWEAIRSYEVKGINSYAKMVKQYRERLLAAHEAQQAAKAGEAA